MATLIKRTVGLIPAAVLAALVGCSTSNEDSTSTESEVAIAYVKRPVATLGNPTDAITFQPGGDLYMRERSSPSAPETCVTCGETQAHDVSDPEVSYDATKLLFSMRRQGDPGWRVWEYDIARRSTRQIECDASASGDDIDPAYLPDGRIVFSSNRQEKSQSANGFVYLDEYERERTAVLHVMNSDGSNCRQISFNQSHDRNPTVLQTGEVMYSRWDHVGERNQFSIFFTNPDGTNLFVLYGAHSPGNSFLHPREMQDGRVLSSLMPLSGTNEGGAMMLIDVRNYSENTEPAPGVTGGQGQRQASVQSVNFGMGISQFGRFSTPYPLWDNTNRALVSWTPSCAATDTCPQEINPVTGVVEDVEATPVYGIYMLDLDDGTTRPVVTAPAGYAVLDPVAIQARPVPNVISDKALNAALAGNNRGVLNVKSVYDTDSQGRMGNAVLVAGECIPRIGIADRCAGSGTATPDLVRLKDPAQTIADQRPARFVRITKAVPTRPGLSREAIGETEFEMQQILGYAEIEPDGSFKIEVPADTPLAIAVVDKHGRAFTPHTNWIQVRPGETRTCNGCHSPRRGNAINASPIAGVHPNAVLAALSGESMAETRTRLFPTMLQLKTDMEYEDVWTDQTAAGRAPDNAFTLAYTGRTEAGMAPEPGLSTPAPVNGVIDYPTHIAPLFAGCAASCHDNNDPDDLDSAGLDLSATVGGTGRMTSYEELLVGDPVLVNGQPQVRIDEDGEIEVVRAEPQVIPGSARSSHLMEVLFHQNLRSDLPLPSVNHSAMLNSSQKRLLAEWIDLGGQYYNSPLDGSNTLRGVTGLSEADFQTIVHPILMSRCASCHQAVGTGGAPNGGFSGQRYVLTGQIEGDFNATLSMIGDITDPTGAYLLSRPASDGIAPNPVHPQLTNPAGAVLPFGSDDYNRICDWINSTGACPAPPP